jgi:Ferritin-like domain
MEPTNSPGRLDLAQQPAFAHPSRRNFLKYAGFSGLAAAALAACNKAGITTPVPGGGTGKSISLGSGDTGILNYAFALEQLEAAFYTAVLLDPYTNMSPFEALYLADIRAHEIAHREFFRTVLGKNAIANLTPNFSSVNFSDRTSVLTTAKTFEDTGVSAYNGAGSLISSATYLTLAGKIVSVEARHAAFIREQLSYGTFADSTVVSAQGLDTSRTPAQVLALVAPFIVETLDGSKLPTS